MRKLLLLAAFLILPAQADDWLYLTVPGDTLSGIGRQYLKNPNDWPKVQSANGVPIPKRLPANSRLKIPVQLLKTTPAPVTVTAVTGNVRYKPAAGSFQKLNVGDQLNGGETVLSGPRSSAAYRFADGTTLTQQASSKLGFGRLAAYGKTGMVSTELSLDSGRLEARASKQLAPAGGFRVITPVAVAGLRGTGFRLNVDEAGKSLRNEVLEGAVAVAAQGKEVRVEGGYGTVTEQGKPPAPPRPLLPAPSDAGLPDKVLRLPLEFAWVPVPGAVGYRAQLARDADFSAMELDDHTATPAIIWPDDLPDGRYFLRLRAIDAAGLEGLNLDHALELDAHPLPPLPTAPALGERLYSNNVQFAWTAAAGAQGYLLQIAPTPEFQQGVVEYRLPAIVQHGETLAEGDWHWRAASLDEAGQAHVWSPHRAFRVQLLPGAPTGGESRVEAGQASFAWGTSKGAARYAFELGSDADLSRPQIQELTDKTAIAAQLEPDKYFWRVRGLEADGQAGAWSPASPVIIPPKQPTGLAVQVHNDTLAASWQGEAAAFRLELAKDAGFSQMLDSVTVQETKAALTPSAPGQYWLRVKAIGVEGAESPASTGVAVEIKRPTPWWLLLFLLPAL